MTLKSPCLRSRPAGVVLDEQVLTSEPTVHVTLYQCSLKADKFEWVLQRGTELGVSGFVPVISAQRSATGGGALKKYARWQQIIQEAAEQSGRTRLPQLHPPLNWRAAVQHAQGVRFMPWEEAIGEAVPALGQAAKTTLTQYGMPTVVNLLLGPEGGISGDEAAEAMTQGWQPVSLGAAHLAAPKPPHWRLSRLQWNDTSSSLRIMALASTRHPPPATRHRHPPRSII
ncbi:MAG: RsmE family RNA methyltransferase [Caldilineaceae bacterium]